MARTTQFRATPQLAAMSQQAHAILGASGAASGATVVPRPGMAAQIPSTFLTNRVNQMQGIARQNQSMVAALKIPTMQAPDRASIYAAAAARAQAAASNPSSYQNSGVLENASQFGNIAGLSDEEIQARAAAYAQGRTYGGGEYRPGMVMQEGHVETRNGVPGIYVKYRTPGGDSTEWTPLQ